MSPAQSSDTSIVTSAKVVTAAGADVFRLTRMRYTEALGVPFELTLDLISNEANLDPDKLLGTAATVSFTLPNGGERYFSGIVDQFEQPFIRGNTGVYRMVVIPWIGLLHLGSTCQIFQGKKPQDVVKAVFDALSFKDYSLSGLTGSYPELPFCVQYNESYLNFVQRVTQRYGISYFCKQENQKHTVVFADSASGYSSFPGYDTIPYNAAADASTSTEHIEEWTWHKRVASGKQVLKDYDYTNPSATLLSTKTATHSYPHGDLERFEYPGHYHTQSEGDTLAQVCMDEATCEQWTATGRARCWGLSAGSTFTLEKFPRSDQNQKYLVTSVDIVVESQPSAGGYSCEARFAAIPASVTFRPARTARVPRIAGMQTADVVGPAAQPAKTPYCDVYGNIRVKFRWDRTSTKNDTCSCWVRYAQFSAGPGWGAVFLPRVGCEVAIAFEEGDPDRPMAIGGFYNGTNSPPPEGLDVTPADKKIPPTPATVKKNTASVIKDDGGNFFAISPDDDAQLVTLYSPIDHTKLMIGKIPS